MSGAVRSRIHRIDSLLGTAPSNAPLGERCQLHRLNHKCNSTINLQINCYHEIFVAKKVGQCHHTTCTFFSVEVRVEHNFERLKSHILPLSECNIFELARLEWTLIGIEVSSDFDNCPCGQPIKEHCYIKNNQNGNTTHVGNVCINRFLGIQTGNLFDGIKRIKADITANANADLIHHAYKFGYIYENEYGFLLKTKNKRILTTKQIEWKIKINKRILNSTVVKNRTKKLRNS